MRGFQVWINLPAANKMDNPEYQEYSSTAFPIAKSADYTVKVLIGRFADKTSPIEDATTHVTYLDVQVKPGRHFQYTLPEENNSLLYLFEGSGQLNGQNMSCWSRTSGFQESRVVLATFNFSCWYSKLFYN